MCFLNENFFSQTALKNGLLIRFTCKNQLLKPFCLASHKIDILNWTNCLTPTNVKFILSLGVIKRFQTWSIKNGRKLVVKNASWSARITCQSLTHAFRAYLQLKAPLKPRNLQGVPIFFFISAFSYDVGTPCMSPFLNYILDPHAWSCRQGSEAFCCYGDGARSLFKRVEKFVTLSKSRDVS